MNSSPFFFFFFFFSPFFFFFFHFLFFFFFFFFFFFYINFRGRGGVGGVSNQPKFNFIFYFFFFFFLRLLNHNIRVAQRFRLRLLRYLAPLRPRKNHNSDQQQSQCCISNTFRDLYALRIKPHLRWYVPLPAYLSHARYSLHGQYPPAGHR